MSKKKNMKKVAAGLAALVLLLSGVPWGHEVNAQEIDAQEMQTEQNTVLAASDEGIQPRSPVLFWVYKNVNGYDLMRLYDATNEKWLTPWLLCPNQ